jgi:hypothetical protein
MGWESGEKATEKGEVAQRGDGLPTAALAVTIIC